MYSILFNYMYNFQSQIHGTYGKLSDIIKHHVTRFGFATSSWWKVPGMQLPEGTIE